MATSKSYKERFQKLVDELLADSSLNGEQKEDVLETAADACEQAVLDLDERTSHSADDADSTDPDEDEGEEEE